MNRKAVRNSRSEKNEDFFQRKQLFNTKLLPKLMLFLETIIYQDARKNYPTVN